VKLLVYAIVGSAGLPHADAGASRLRAVTVGRLAAIVDRRRSAPAPTLRNVRQYHRTVAAIADSVPAILPARFGTLVGEEELSFILRTRAVSLRAALQRLGGRVQMTIRIVNRRSETLAAMHVVAPRGRSRAAATRRAARTEGPGARYLRSRVAREDPETRRLLAPVRQAVRRWVHQEEVTLRAGVTSVYHLVSRRSSAAYARSLQAAARRAGVDLVLSGPFPPYAFAATM
jgi:hypothetical protein